MVSGAEYKLTGTANFRIQGGEVITIRGAVAVCSFALGQGFLTTTRMTFSKFLNLSNDFLIKFIVVSNETREPYLYRRKLQLAN